MVKHHSCRVIACHPRSRSPIASKALALRPQLDWNSNGFVMTSLFSIIFSQRSKREVEIWLEQDAAQDIVQLSNLFICFLFPKAHIFHQRISLESGAELQRNILRSVGWDPLGARPSCHRLAGVHRVHRVQSCPVHCDPRDPHTLRPFVGIQQMLGHHLHMFGHAGQQLTSTKWPTS